jgi:hypothetical protein
MIYRQAKADSTLCAALLDCYSKPRVLLMQTLKTAGRSADWLAHLPWEQGVGGSNPLAPTNKIII